MFLLPFEIHPNLTARDIVSRDARTADVFRRYGIEYCCGGRWPLEMVCNSQSIHWDSLKSDLERALQSITISNQLPFESWSTDFLVDYIINVHHAYLRETLPAFFPALAHFTEEHRKKYPALEQLTEDYQQLEQVATKRMQQQETELFPYLKHLAHAAEDNDPYGKLLVRTMGKPFTELVTQEDHLRLLHSFRTITNNYTPPPSSCSSHQVVFAKLREIDQDMAQHYYLENKILFPRAVEMEKKLLNRQE